MEGRIFRIPSSSLDVGFVDACAAYLTPNMSLSQVRPSGANLRRFAIEPKSTHAPIDRPSASSFLEEDNVAKASALKIDLATPVFQSLHGETGRTWFAIEYGITTDNSSLMSSGSATEHEDSDEEMMSFDQGPEPFNPLVQDRLPSDEYLDDLQQGLLPRGSEPKSMEYDPLDQEIPVRPSLNDTMRRDMETKTDTWEDPPMSPERAPTPTIGFSYDYMTDEPPAIQRIAEAPMHSSPYKDPPKLRARAVPALLAPRPRSTSVPPTPTTVTKMTKRYMPVTEEVTQPISPARAVTDPATPPPVSRPGRGRGRGKWRAQSSETPGVGT